MQPCPGQVTRGRPVELGCCCNRRAVAMHTRRAASVSEAGAAPPAPRSTAASGLPLSASSQRESAPEAASLCPAPRAACTRARQAWALAGWVGQPLSACLRGPTAVRHSPRSSLSRPKCHQASLFVGAAWQSSTPYSVPSSSPQASHHEAHHRAMSTVSRTDSLTACSGQPPCLSLPCRRRSLGQPAAQMQ